MLEVLAEIPSPSSSSVSLGPLEIRAYGVAIALGVLAAVELSRRRWQAMGHNPDEMSSIFLWAVPAGLIGSRIYHVITDYQRFQGHWGDAVKIWEGGLGIPGGIIGGVGVGVYLGWRRGMPLAEGLDAIAPALPLAQAIGRLGNWFNQELYGEPTDLPWALEIDPEHRVTGLETQETFHPTFLYESLWNLALVGFLLWIDRRRVLRPGRLIAVYVAGYGLGRLWIEALRVDPASQIAGVRVNIWVSLLALVGGLGFIVFGGIRSRDRAEPDPKTAEVPTD